jgi:tetratricopeptide (TPR) repeat protein
MDRHSIDNPEIGTIFLHRVAGVDGFTVTATTALAPREARKTYEQGLAAIHHNLPDEAQRSFLQAVELFPRFAAAWLELGSVYERRDHFPQARDAYRKAIEADSGYLDPYQRLYRMALKESNWQEAADVSDKVLRLNPYDFPGAYYVNAVANFRLHDLDLAEKRARQASQLQGPQAEPAAHYVLGSILAEKGDFAGSADALRTFLNAAVGGSDRASAEKLLHEMERSAQAKAVNPTEFPEP